MNKLNWFFVSILLLIISGFAEASSTFNQIWEYSPLKTYKDPSGQTTSVKTFSRVVWYDHIPLVSTRATLVEMKNLKTKSSLRDLEVEMKKTFPAIKNWNVKYSKKFVELSGNWEKANRTIRMLYFIEGSRSFAVSASSNNAFHRINDLDVDLLFTLFKKYYTKSDNRTVFLNLFDWLVGSAYAQVVDPTGMLNQIISGGSTSGGGGGTSSDGSSANSNALTILGGGNTVMTINSPDLVTQSQYNYASSVQMNQASQNGVIATQNGVIASQNGVLASQIAQQTSLQTGQDAITVSNINQQTANQAGRDAIVVSNINQQTGNQAGRDAIVVSNINQQTANQAGRDGIDISKINQQTGAQAGKDGIEISKINQQTASQAGKDGVEISKINQQTAAQLGKDTLDAAKIGQATTAQAGQDMITATNIAAGAAHESAAAIDHAASAADEFNRITEKLSDPRYLATAAFATVAGGALGSLAVSLAVDGISSAFSFLIEAFRNKDEMKWNKFQDAMSKWQLERDSLISITNGDMDKLKNLSTLLNKLPKNTVFNENLTASYKKMVYGYQAQIKILTKKNDNETDCVDCVAKNMEVMSKAESDMKSVNALLEKIQTKKTPDAIKSELCNTLMNYKLRLNSAMEVFQGYRNHIRQNLGEALRIIQERYEKTAKENASAASKLADVNSDFNGMVRDFDKQFSSDLQQCFQGKGVYGEAIVKERGRMVFSTMPTYARRLCRSKVEFVWQNKTAPLTVDPNHKALSKAPFISDMIDYKILANQAQAEQECLDGLNNFYSKTDYTKNVDINNVPECGLSPSSRTAIELFIKNRDINKLLEENQCRK